jgi:hypothetical protein
MAVIVRSSDDDTISLPSRLLDGLNWREGDEVRAFLEGKVLRLARLNEFLSLRGILADDQDFERAIEFMDRAWKSWTMTGSA